MGREQVEDSELLRAAATGDQRSFDALMSRHEDMVFGIAFRMLGNRPDALDAVQDTFITVFKQAGSFRGESQFTTWLYRVAVNACHDLLRKRQRWQGSGERPEEPGPGSGPEEAVTRIDVSRALAELPPEYREAVVMFDIGGIPYEEIARLTGVAIGTVKSRISRGRRRLAALLEHPTGSASSKEKT